MLQALGGVKYMVLSHRDDVADHKKWASEMGCSRIMHETECNRHQGTDAVERKVRAARARTSHTLRGAPLT